jgi:hypothetical protein
MSSGCGPVCLVVSVATLFVVLNIATTTVRANFYGKRGDVDDSVAAADTLAGSRSAVAAMLSQPDSAAAAAELTAAARLREALAEYVRRSRRRDDDVWQF